MHFIYIWYNVIHIENQKFFHRKPSIYAVYISYPQFVDNLWITCGIPIYLSTFSCLFYTYLQKNAFISTFLTVHKIIPIFYRF